MVRARIARVAILWLCQGAAIPWATGVYFFTRRRLTNDLARNRLGPLTAVTTFFAIFSARVLIGVLAAEELMDEPICLSPLILLVSAAPAIWYLAQQRERRAVVGLILLPVLLTAACLLRSP
jgi:hypothetical protein